jgi:hypothetical protein
MKDFEFDESPISKTSQFTVEVDESTVECTTPKLVPQAKNPLDLRGAVLLKTAPENVVVARNYAETVLVSDVPNKRLEDLIDQIALQKFAELTVADFFNANGIPTNIDLKTHRIDKSDFDSVLQTAKGFNFHVKVAEVSFARREVGPTFLISTSDSLNQFLPKNYLLGCLVSKNWQEMALLFSVSSLDVRNHYRSPLRFMPRHRCVYHITIRELAHEDRWGCLRTLVQKQVKNVEITDDDGLSIAD